MSKISGVSAAPCSWTRGVACHKSVKSQHFPFLGSTMVENALLTTASDVDSARSACAHTLLYGGGGTRHSTLAIRRPLHARAAFPERGSAHFLHDWLRRHSSAARCTEAARAPASPGCRGPARDSSPDTSTTASTPASWGRIFAADSCLSNILCSCRHFATWVAVFAAITDDEIFIGGFWPDLATFNPRLFLAV